MWHPLSNIEFLPKNKHDYKQLQIYLEGKKLMAKSLNSPTRETD